MLKRGLARMATASPKGRAEVSPVGFEFDGKYFWGGSHQDILHRTKRYRNITKGNARVSIMTWCRWIHGTGIEVSGRAEVMEHAGTWEGDVFRIRPTSPGG